MHLRNKNDVSILVCCHKEDFFYDGLGFMPIQVGKSLSKTDLGITGDNTGDNISLKNPNYCELTAHYWYWKNGEKKKYIGLNHYRRYFDFNKVVKRPMNCYNISIDEVDNSIFSLPNLDEMFKNCDIILPSPNIYPFSLEDDYRRCHIDEDLQHVRKIINEFYPEYSQSYIDTIIFNNSLSHYNMFLTKYNIFEEYSRWIFDVLFKLEGKISISNYPAQARVFGYISERLLNVYVHKCGLRVKYLPVIKISGDANESIVRYLGRKIRNDIVFSLFLKRSLGTDYKMI